jgi:ribosomal protein S27E
VKYERHRPEASRLYQIIEQHWPQFQAALARQSKHLPKFVMQEFEEYLKCGRLEHGFLRVRCESCCDEKLVAFSCKRRGFCPSCGARRMADSAAHLVDEILPDNPIRQWVLSVPFALRFLFVAQPGVMSKVLGIVYRVISTFLNPDAAHSTYTCSTLMGCMTSRAFSIL